MQDDKKSKSGRSLNEDSRDEHSDKKKSIFFSWSRNRSFGKGSKKKDLGDYSEWSTSVTIVLNYFSSLFYYIYSTLRMLINLPVCHFSVMNVICLSPQALQVVTDGENHRALCRLVQVWNLPHLVLEKMRWVKCI